MKKILKSGLLGLICTGLSYGQIRNSTSLVTHFVSSTSGGSMNNGPHIQHTLSKDFGKSFSGFIWGNYDLGMRTGQRWNEVDIGLTKEVNIGKNLKGKLEYQHWEIPEERLNFLNCGIKYGSKTNYTLDWKNPLGTGSSLIFGSNISLKKIDLKFKLGYLMNFFGETGFSYASLEVKKSLPKKLNLNINYHKSLMNTKKDVFYGGIEFNWN